MLLALVNAPGVRARGLAYDAWDSYDFLNKQIAAADPPGDLFTLPAGKDQVVYYRLLHEPAGSPARVWLAATLARILAEVIG